jgi:uncharacterized NAD-dependent epimerase/dehydratase family protein
MTAALEIVRALQRAGTRAAFVATGQTGLLIGGRGAAVDAVAGDFIAGAIEHEVVEAARDADVVVVEGQGALHHPGFSGVTLGLLHGACPAALVLCHEAGRERLRISAPDAAAFPIPTLAEAALAAEAAAAWVRPARVVGVALNTWRLEETAARDALDAAAREAGVPAADPVRFGAQALAAAVLEARARGMGRDHAADA